MPIFKVNILYKFHNARERGIVAIMTQGSVIGCNVSRL